MKKRSLLLGVLLCLFPMQQAGAMQAPAASMGTTLFKYGMIGANAAALTTLFAVVTGINHEEFKKQTCNILPADDETKKFVKQTLREYDFDPALIDKLHVASALGLTGENGFAYFTGTILVPIDKSRLMIAQELNKKEQQKTWSSWFSGLFKTSFSSNNARNASIDPNFTYEGDKIEKNYLSLQQSLNRFPKNDDHTKQLLQVTGRYVGKNSIDVWKAALAHETGHAMQPDLSISQPLAMIVGVLTFRYGIYNSTKMLNKLFLKNELYKKIAIPNTKNIFTGLGQIPATVLSLPGSFVGTRLYLKYVEYDADTTAIKKINDPVVLRAAAEAFKSHEILFDHQFAEKFPKAYAYCLKHPILFELLDTHPRSSKRAKRFIKRAEELEMQKKADAKKNN